MEQSISQSNEKRDTLDNMLALVEKAAFTIDQLQSKAQLQEQRIRALEETESQLRQDAERYQRFKAYVQSLPAAEGGFSVQGNSYQSFDEAFDAAYAAIRQPA
jgi:DNA-binding protein H-NS